MEKVTISREQLFNMVWSEPLSRLARKFNISDNGLRKICKRMNVPIPPMGHWQKVQYGKQVVVPKLPGNYEGKNEVSLEEMGVNERKDLSAVVQLRQHTITIENQKELLLKVPERLTTPDALIKSTMEYHEAVRKYRWGSHARYPDRINVLNIEATDVNRPRAFRLMDTIIKVLRMRSHNVQTDDCATYALIENEKVKFRLRERHSVSGIKDRIGSRQYITTGELIFVIDIGSYTRKEVKDSHEPIETKISTIIAMLELEGKRMKEERIASEIRRKQWEEQQRIEQELRERQDKEAKAFKKLFLKAIRLHQANILRNYIKTVEANTIKEGKLTEEFTKWLTWAEKKVSWYDPLINDPDPLLTDHYKTHLFKDFLKEWQ